MKIGLALSGGGAKGAAHIGAIKALEEENIKIDIITGTSSGSIVTVLYAMGFSIDDMLKLFDEFAKALVETSTKYLISNIALNKNFLPQGTRSGESIELAVNQVAEYKKMSTIDQIKMPIAIPTVDMVSGKEYVFTNSQNDEDYYIKNANIGKAVRASCSFPGIYAPCLYKKHHFIDGGVLDNIPVKEAKKLGADKVIAINFKTDEMPKKVNMYSILLRSLDIMTGAVARQNLQDADYVLDFILNNVGVLEISKLSECYKIGYEETKKNMEEIKKMLNKNI